MSVPAQTRFALLHSPFLGASAWRPCRDALAARGASAAVIGLGEALAAGLRAAARDGRVPPWPAWFSSGVLARLLPDPSERERLIADAPTAPLAYLEAPAPALVDWPPKRGCAYLQLSDGYGAEAGLARDLGWPVASLEGGHLAILTAPEAVCEAIIALAERIAPTSS